ncbi:MAG: HPr(Ser) kinase/phosphatase [Clostridiales bacterium]|nr:HPr(Ser) kinase/phosphatase [Clostridiales bacterium]
MYKVSVQKMREQFGLINLTEKMSLDDKFLTCPEINRPALQLTGFFDYFSNDRLQIIGFVEHSYMEGLEPAARTANLVRLFERNIPCIVVCRNLSVSEEVLNLAYKYGTPVLGDCEPTSDFMGEVIKWLKVEMAPRMTVHGGLVDIYGEGILITGESGIGKTETALELIKRGHRLVADDLVEIKKVSNTTLVGSCPAVLQHFIEIRGIGIVDVRQMFGVASLKTTQNVDLVLNLEAWDDNKNYDRLGTSAEYKEYLGNQVVCYNIPVRPGRNVAIICESAAINHRLKKMGYNAPEVFSAKIEDKIYHAKLESQATAD